MFPDFMVGCYWILWSDVFGFTGQVSTEYPTGNNFVFKSVGPQNNTYNGSFTFTDTTITFIPASGQSWRTFTQGYTLSGNVLDLADGNNVFAVGEFTKQGNDTGIVKNKNMDKILRVDKEVRDLFFYSSDGENPDVSWDSGTIAAVCTDYAAEFYYRYKDDVFLVFIPGGGGLANWCSIDWLPANTYNWRTKKAFGNNAKYKSGNIWEYDGVLRDAHFKIIASEQWIESSHKNILSHMWCVVIDEGIWYLVDTTWRDGNGEINNPIKEIPIPNWAK